MTSEHWPYSAPWTRSAKARSAPRGAGRRTLVGDLVLPIGYAAAAVLAAALAMADGSRHMWWSLAVFAALTALVSGQTRLLRAPAVAVVCWLFFDGFLVNRHAELAWRSADRTGLAVLLCAALAGAATAAVARRRDRS